MATDFTYGGKQIVSGGPFKPSGKDMPSDARTRVDCYADIASIPNPHVGLKITVKVDETNNNKMTDYIVKSLKADSIGIENSVIDEVERYVDYLGVSGASGEGLTTEQSQQLATAYTHSQTPHVQQSDIPTRTSNLTNDSDFVTSTEMTNAINEAQLSGGSGLTEEQSQQLQTAYQHSQSPHVQNELIPITENEYNNLSSSEKADKFYAITDSVEEEYSLQLVGDVLSLLKGSTTISSIILPTVSSGGSEIVNGEIVISEENISIKKGNSKSINISLASAPTNSQIVNINCNNNKITIEPSQLTFNSSNYSEQQSVTISVNASITESSSIITVSSENVSSKNITLQITENAPIAGDNITSVTNGLIHSYDFSQGTGNQETLNDLTGNCNIKLINFTFEAGETQNCGWNDDGSLSTNNSTKAYAFIDTTNEEYNLDNLDFTIAIKAQINGDCFILSSTSNKTAAPETGICHIGYANRIYNISIKTDSVYTPDPSSLLHKVPYGTTDVFVVTYLASTRTITIQNSTEILASNVLAEDINVKTMKYLFTGNYNVEFRKDNNKIYKLAIYNKCLSDEEISTVVSDLA